MFRNLCSGLAVSQGKDPFLEYSSLPRMGDPSLGWVSFEAIRLCSSFQPLWLPEWCVDPKPGGGTQISWHLEVGPRLGFEELITTVLLVL